MRKRLFALLAVITLVCGSAYAYDADGNINKKREVEGAPAYFPYREYQLVRYGATSQGITANLSAGDVVIWDCISDDGVSVNLVTTAGSSDAAAGVVVSTTILTADVTGTTAVTDWGKRNWGYIQVKGYNTNINMIGTPTAGGAIKVSDSARNADTAVSTTGEYKGRSIGFAMDANSDGEAMINL